MLYAAYTRTKPCRNVHVPKSRPARGVAGEFEGAGDEGVWRGDEMLDVAGPR